MALRNSLFCQFAVVMTKQRLDFKFLIPLQLASHFDGLGHRVDDPGRQVQGIDELVLGPAGMD